MVELKEILLPDIIGIVYSSYAFTFPCLAGFLCARYLKWKLSIYLYYIGAAFWSVSWIRSPTFYHDYSGWHGLLFTMGCGACGIATLIFYHRAIKGENQRREQEEKG